MHTQFNALLISDALFSTDLEWLTVMHGERFRLRDPADIQRFFAAVGRLTDEVAS